MKNPLQWWQVGSQSQEWGSTSPWNTGLLWGDTVQSPHTLCPWVTGDLGTAQGLPHSGER